MARRLRNHAEHSVRLLFLGGLVWLLAAACYGQRYPILPVPNSPHGIYALMQDSKSRLWLGTSDGLYCFDGTHFYSMRQYGALKGTVVSLAEDGEGGIWIGTNGYPGSHNTDMHPAWGGNLYRFYGGKMAVVREGDVLGVVRLTPGEMLASIRGPDSNVVYADLYRFTENHGAWEATRVLRNGAGPLSVDGNGTTWFPCNSGYCSVSREAIGKLGTNHNSDVTLYGVSLPVHRVLRDRYGYVWIRTEAVVGYESPGAHGNIALLPHNLAGLDELGNLQEMRDGSILLLNKLAMGRPDAFHVADARNGAPSILNAAVEGNDGTIWLGGEDGLYRFMYPFHLEYWTQDNGLDTPYSVTRVGDGIYTAEVGSGIAKLNPQRSFWTQFVDPSAGLGLMVDLLPGPHSTLLSTTGGSLAEFDTSGKLQANNDSDDGGMRLARTPDGTLWLGGDNFISRVSQTGNLFVVRHENLPKADTLDFQIDSHGNLWACGGKGLLYLNTGVWQTISGKDGLLNWPCISIAAHPNGDIWLGYQDRAEFAVIRNAEASTRSVQNFTNGGKIADAETKFLDVDDNGWLWRGSKNGVYVANLRDALTSDWLHLDKQDGLPALETNQNSFFHDTDGSIWFGAENTITHFMPAAGFANQFPAPKVFISGYSLSGKEPMLAETEKSIPSSADFTAHIGSLQFDRRNALHIRYRLLPEHAEWTATGDFDLRLGRLGWGVHKLQVQAQLATGPWSEIESDSFTVLKPMWLTWPALGGYALFFGVILEAGRRWRKQRKRWELRTFPKVAEWRLAALSPELQHLDGTLLDSRFEVGRILARGGFATVTEGRDLKQDGRRCAIKIFRQEVVDKEWIARRFHHEVLALEQIQHPNVVRIFGSGTTPSGSFYLVMEYIEGETLRELLEIGRLAPERIARYLRQAGGALDQIHRRGICHRDLKPENLMIRTASPAEEELVLIDFSIAIVKDPDETLHGLSRAAGTIYYMAPEQAIGYADSSTDIYSLAKILIEMLSGKRLSTLLPNASMDLPERVRELLDALSVGLSPSSIALISSALEFDPARRPKNAGEFAEQIAQDLDRV